MKKYGAVVFAASLAAGSIASAQNAGPASPQQQRQELSKLGDRAPSVPRPLEGSQTGQIQALMATNGGSLLQAAMAATPDPAQARLRDVSYFSVPEPTPHVLKKHDIVTVIVQENSQFESKGSTDLKQEQDIDDKIDSFIQLKLSNWEIKGLPPPANVPEIKAELQREFKADGDVNRTDTLTARIAVEVVDVKPNGTMVLQGSKRIKTDDEEQQFILTGTCRVEDIAADDTILSNQLYNLTLEKKHEGAVRDNGKRPWLSYLLDKIKPF